MDGDWVRLGGAVRDARNGRGLSQEELAEVAGKKRTVIQTIERGHQFRRITVTLRNVERVLGWSRGSVEIILAGGDPVPSEESDEQVTGSKLLAGLGEGLPLRTSRALTQGATLDTKIVPLAKNADMVVVVKAKSEASAEELQEALLAWEKIEGMLARLRELPGEPPSSPEA